MPWPTFWNQKPISPISFNHPIIKEYRIMKMKLTSILAVIASTVLFTACGDQTNQSTQQEPHGDHAGEDQAEGTVSLTSMQRETIGMELGTLQNRNLGGNVSTINVIEGDEVQKGQTLALLEHPDFVQLQVDLQQNSSRLVYLQQEYERQQNLYEQGVGSGKAFQEAQAEFSSVKARVEGLKAKLNMVNLNVDSILEGEVYRTIPVVSPIKGFVRSVPIRIGEYVA